MSLEEALPWQVKVHVPLGRGPCGCWQAGRPAAAPGRIRATSSARRRKAEVANDNLDAELTGIMMPLPVALARTSGCQPASRPGGALLSTSARAPLAWSRTAPGT